MNNSFAKVFLRGGLFLALTVITGCSATHPTAPPSTASPTAPATAAVLPSPSPYLTTSTQAMTSTPTVPPTQPIRFAAASQASFVNENYPDNSVLKPGQEFVKTFEIKNTGSTPWTTSYLFVLDPPNQNETMGSPGQVNLIQDTPPGGTVSISIPLTAPTAPGTCLVLWALMNESREIVPIDGGSHVWLKIRVCDPNQPCNAPAAGGGATAAGGGVTVTLSNFGSDPESAIADFCMTLPNRNYGPGGGSVSLVVDQKTTLASSGGSLTPGCFEFDFPISAAQIMKAQQVSISIDNVRILGGASDADCEAARSKLKQQHPGLDFQCDLSSGLYYTHLQLPAGMTQDEANTLIVDTIEGAIYGPWTLTIK